MRIWILWLFLVDGSAATAWPEEPFRSEEECSWYGEQVVSLNDEYVSYECTWGPPPVERADV